MEKVHTKDDYKTARTLATNDLKGQYDFQTIKSEMIRQFRRGTKILATRNQPRPMITKSRVNDTYYLHPDGLETFKQCLAKGK